MIQLIICGLAGWRLASMLVNEDGPFEIFERIRALFGTPREGELRENVIAKMLECVWCTSPWTGLLMWGLWYAAWWLPSLFAVAAIAVIVEQFTKLARRSEP